jgi:hypothetical protein
LSISPAGMLKIELKGCKEMKKTIYLGMENKPHDVFETAYVKNFKVVYQYENNNGKKVMLKATKDNLAYAIPHNFVRYPNHLLPACKKDNLYSVDILGKGYSGHHFELVEV